MKRNMREKKQMRRRSVRKSRVVRVRAKHAASKAAGHKPRNTESRTLQSAAGRDRDVVGVVLVWIVAAGDRNHHALPAHLGRERRQRGRCTFGDEGRQRTRGRVDGELRGIGDIVQRGRWPWLST